MNRVLLDMPNHNYEIPLTPIIPSSPKTIEFDFDGIKCGVAEYTEGPTGCTVLLFEDKAGNPSHLSFYADRRGGAVGAVFDDFGIASGICLAGGSLYGLEAPFGVIKYFHEKTDYSNDWMKIPDVPGAIIFDFGPRSNSIFPDKQLGYAASKSALPGRIPIGRVGAGRMATVGKGFDYTLGEFAGQGAAFRQFGDTKILAITVLNSIGALYDKEGKLVLGHMDREKGKRIDLLNTLVSTIESNTANHPGKNTTLTVVITNQKFSPYLLKQISKQVHSSMSQMIKPFHTSSDGDILFFVSTGEIENSGINDVKFGMLVSDTLWDAVLSVIDSG